MGCGSGSGSGAKDSTMNVLWSAMMVFGFVLFVLFCYVMLNRYVQVSQVFLPLIRCQHSYFYTLTSEAHRGSAHA